MSAARSGSLLALALLAMPLAGVAKPIQLNDPDGVRVIELAGVATGDRAGYSVSGAGDFNGDGFADVIVGAYRARRDDEAQGQVYIIFGSGGELPPRIDLGSLDGTNGFVVRGAEPGDLAGLAVAGIGDFNGDGIADVAIAAPVASTIEQTAGRVYVLFGRRGPFEPVMDLARLTPEQGIVIEGSVRGEAGHSISGLGDFNGDGFNDLAIGAPTTRNQYGNSAGRVYVVFGGDDWPDRLHLNVLEREGRGFAIEGRRGGDRAGWAVGGGGDFNGNGFPELLVGAPRLFNPDPLDTGEAYIVFGGRGPHSFDLSLFYLNGENGARITGYHENQWLGTSVSAIGDLNGDGASALLVGASKTWPGGKPDGVDEGGQTYLLYSAPKSQRVIIPVAVPDMWRLGHFDGPFAGDFLGWATAGTGDTDGDGIPDFLLSAHSADPVDANAGRSYLVRGRKSGYMASNDMRLFDPEDLEIFEGRGRWQISGVSLSGAGDFNGDGLADMIIGAPGGSPREGDQIGRAFIVLGKRIAEPTELAWTAWHAEGAAPLLPIGGPIDGRVYPPDSRCWIGFDGGSGDGFQQASRTTVTRLSTARDENFARVSWRIETERAEWQSARIRLKWLEAEVEGLDAAALRVVYRADESEEWVEVADQSIMPDRRHADFTVTQLGEFTIARSGD